MYTWLTLLIDLLVFVILFLAAAISFYIYFKSRAARRYFWSFALAASLLLLNSVIHLLLEFGWENDYLEVALDLSLLFAAVALAYGMWTADTVFVKQRKMLL